MGGELKDPKLMKLFLRAIDPYGGLKLWETEDGFITNEHWAVRKEFIEPLQYRSYVRGRKSEMMCNVLERILKGDEERNVERNVAVYNDFDYYAVRTRVVDGRKLLFYVLDIPVLFKKVLVLTKYVDFLEAIVSSMCSEARRKLYYIEVLKGNGIKELEAYFVWYRVNEDNVEENDIVAVCAGYIERDN
jgi:hypothetical protein